MRADDWMARIDDAVFLNQISIPGSHDSATGEGWTGFLGSIAGASSATTQSKKITEQWDLGIRAFDLRPAMGSGMPIYHGVCQTKITLIEALNIICDKLDAHPSEFAVILMRHETDGDSNNSGWGDAMSNHLLSGRIAQHIVTYHPRLTMGQLRGKMVVLTRDHFYSPSVGLVSGWSHSSDFANQQNGTISCGSAKGDLYVQDYYDCTGTGGEQTKVEAVRRMNQFASKLHLNTTMLNTLVVNHCSGYTKSASSDGNRALAETANSALLATLLATANQPGPTGIVLMDFAGEEYSGSYFTKGLSLTANIINRNFLYTPIKDSSNIETVECDSLINGPTYDLQGRPLSAPSKGLQIANGRKILKR